MWRPKSPAVWGFSGTMILAEAGYYTRFTPIFLKTVEDGSLSELRCGNVV